MRLKCLACEALARVVYLCAAHSPHIVDVELFRIGLHREPADLRARLQARIDAVDQEGMSLPSAQGKLSSAGETDAHSGWPNPSGFAAYDAIAMVYGLCGQSTAGLVARDVPLHLQEVLDDLRMGRLQIQTVETQAAPTFDRLGRRLFSGLVVASLNVAAAITLVSPLKERGWIAGVLFAFAWIAWLAHVGSDWFKAWWAKGRKR